MIDGNENLTEFEDLYKKYYIFLCLVAEHIVRSREDAEEIVSDVFLKLWQNKEKIIIDRSVKGYLIKAVHNTSLNFLQQNKKSRETDSLSVAEHKILAWDSDYPLGRLYEQEIIKILASGIESMPCACREIFTLSRNREMKYSEIAAKLGISVNTVKTQMKIALSHLRIYLKDYIALLLLISLNKG